MAKSDEVRLADNGEVVLLIDGKEYKWRRPKAKEYRELNEMAIRLGEHIEITDKDLPTQEQLLEEKDPKKAKELVSKINSATIEATESTLALCSSWFIRGFALLSTPAFEGDEEDMPIWVMDAKVIRDIINHWLSVPLVAPGT